MKQSIQLRLGQHLTMTPQLQQAIRLLQLSSLELQLEIQRALESNFMLEAVDNGEEETAPPTYSATGANGTDSGAAPPESESAPAEGATAEELPVDSAWEDVYDAPLHAAAADREEQDYPEPQGGAGETLREHLVWQLRLSPFTETDFAIAMAIIDAVNEDGYLTVPLEDIHQGLSGELGIELDEVEAVLHRIQRFDPVGVAARTPAECLLVQLGQFDPSTPWLAQAETVIKEHLDLLADHDYPQLVRRLKISQQDLQQVIALIRSLNPRPGTLISDARPEYIIPDVFVRKRSGAWRVELNPETTPRLRINPYYASLVRRADNSHDNACIKNHLQEARWFLKSLRSRHETLLKVATSIVERQRAFLEYGEEAMKPLVLRDVAEAVSMHESTISRVTTQKYMLTPRGIFEFKFFFSSHVGTADGGECSATAIRAMIKKLIASEEHHRPLSDSKIANLLAQQGINVARRTVAKYREAMSIAPSNERKRQA